MTQAIIPSRLVSAFSNVPPMTAADFLFNILGRKNTRTGGQGHHGPRNMPSGAPASLTFNRSSANPNPNPRDSCRASDISGSNGSGSTIPAGCCAFLVSGLRQGVTFISLIKEQEYPEVVTSRKTILVWLHSCASLGYALGRLIGGPSKSCLGPRATEYALGSGLSLDPIGISIISFELHSLFTSPTKKKSGQRWDTAQSPIPGLPQVIVVVPAYAKGKASLERLEEALEVLATQTLMPLAVLLIDDCGPRNLVEHFEGSLPHFKKRTSGKDGKTLSGIWRNTLNVLVLRLQANRGPAFARNVGLRAAVGSFPPPDPLLSNSGPGLPLPRNPRTPSLPGDMMVACLLDLGCVPSGKLWTFHHASTQASIGNDRGGVIPTHEEAGKVPAVGKGDSAGKVGSVGKLGGIVVGRAMASKTLDSVGVYHDLFGTLNCRKLEDGSLLYGTSCNMSIPVNLFLVDPPNKDQAGPSDTPQAGPSDPSQAHKHSLVRFDETFPAPAFEDVQICLDARSRGIPLVEDSSNEASVIHDYNYSSYGLFLQYLRYGRHEWRVLKGHRKYLEELGASHITSNY